jgi:hypothetical protein
MYWLVRRNPIFDRISRLDIVHVLLVIQPCIITGRKSQTELERHSARRGDPRTDLWRVEAVQMPLETDKTNIFRGGFRAYVYLRRFNMRFGGTSEALPAV